MRRYARLVVWAWLLAGCAEPARPWDGKLDGSVVDESKPFLAPQAPDAGWLGAGNSSVDSSDGGRISRVGGLWVSCYGGFQRSGELDKDLTRLTLMCGPVNGMVRASAELMRGEVSAGTPALAFAMKAVRGECYRLFAVADAGVVDLDVVVTSERGTRLAADDGEDGWPIVSPERPFCTFEDDTFQIAISAKKGKGRFVAQVWKLGG